MKIVKFLVLAMSLSSLGFAADLDDRLAKARSDKAVMEQVSGYLKAVSTSKEIAALVEEVNAKRKEKYKQVAAQTPGVTLQAVEQTAGQKLVDKYK